MNRDINQRLIELVHHSVQGTLTSADHAELEQLLLESSAVREQYFLLVDLEYGLAKLAEEEAGKPFPTRSTPLSANNTPSPASIAWPLIALTLVGLIAIPLTAWLMQDRDVAKIDPLPETTSPALANDPAAPQPTPAMQIVQLARTRFFDEPQAFAPGDSMQLDHDYALVEGSVQMRSSTGAEMIVQAPAVFSIQSAEQVLLKVGNCSVYAPEGAEGFRVLTPQAEVVDKGTRFSINVKESGEADVEVIEGAAEVFPVGQDEKSTSTGLLLEAGQARAINALGEIASTDAARFGETYRATLPDRIVSFEATPKNADDPNQLQSVTVQRGGKSFTYNVDQLVGFDLIHFKVGTNTNNMTTPLVSIDMKQGDDSRRRVEYLDRDRSLCTGLLNPGGNAIPLTTDPDITSEDLDARTPGLAIRFEQPVVNGPGPDIVFFDLQVVHHPEQGDPFHVSPLHFETGLKTVTIANYDISLADRGAHALCNFRLYGFDRRIRSIEELCRAHHNNGVAHAVPAKVIATGIDLSDLGYPEGAEVQELFIQDAMDDDNLIDPVFIGGFPPVTPPASTQEPTSTEE
ncbi:FecR domain-containing protein [Bremerella sp. JC817]|uniref:FecR domain-containing protein n=1 Tax=Bremerella sp. JC817 TaxID=3231756 RepID=UPI00345B149D